MAPIPLNDFIRQIEELYAEPMRSPRTRQQMVKVLRDLEDLGVKTTADLIPGLVRAIHHGPVKRSEPAYGARELAPTSGCVQSGRVARSLESEPVQGPQDETVDSTG